MSKLSKNLGKKFVITCELSPPRGPDLTSFFAHLEKLKKFKNKISGVNVVDIPGSRLLMCSLVASIIVKQNSLEPIMHIVCRDRNMLALQADLIGASAFGIENVLALTGDHPACKSSDHPLAKPVFDLDSSTLIHTIKLMNLGKDFSGNKINKETNFFVGAAINPNASPLEPEVWKTKRKLNLGANFFQTQAIFDSMIIENFLDSYKKIFNKEDNNIENIENKIIVGALVIHNYEMLRFLRKIPGLIIPKKTITKFKNSKNIKEEKEEGISICLELIDSIKEMNLAGIYIMCYNNNDDDIFEKLLSQI